VDGQVLLDAGVVTRCRRRVHLEHDPAMAGAQRAEPDPTAEQRKADAAAHRRAVANRLATLFGADWFEVPADAPTAERAALTAELLAAGVRYVWGAVLPIDAEHGRRGTVELLVRVDNGYLPLIVVRHKVTDPGSGAPTTPLAEPTPLRTHSDPLRRVRPQPRDQLRLAHALRLLQTAGLVAKGWRVGGVIGLDADVVLWHDLSAPTWPGGRSALAEYDARFADRMAVARAAIEGAEPLAKPSRVTECRSCPWWPVCEESLRAERDVSLVLRGEDAVALRAIGLSTVDELAACDPDAEPPVPLAGMSFADAVLLSRAWQADLALVRRVPAVRVPRADVELDVDMESFGDAGAYLWGCHLSGADIGLTPGYRPFVTWRPLPTEDEARSFAAFWAFLATVRARAAARGLSFRAFCYNELAENRWLVSSARRFAGRPGIPPVAAVTAFIQSSAWVDLFGVVNRQFLCAHGKGLKTIAPAAGFGWRDTEAGGENSMRWYRLAVGLDGGEPDPVQRKRLLIYNEDDVLATWTLRRWMSSPDVLDVPYAGDL
jgi:predicted RecB family nuclease